jgi:hypothetical protein
MGLQGHVFPVVCLFFILMELLLEWSLLLTHTLTWSSHPYWSCRDIIFCSFFHQLAVNLGCRYFWILCHVLHPQSQPPQHTSLTGQDLVAYHSLFWAAACIVSKAEIWVLDWMVAHNASSLANAIYDSCVRLYGLHFVCSEDDITQFLGLKSTVNRVSLPTDHLGRRIGEAYFHFTDKEMGDWAIQKQYSKMRHS